MLAGRDPTTARFERRQQVQWMNNLRSEVFLSSRELVRWSDEKGSGFSSLVVAKS